MAVAEAALEAPVQTGVVMYPTLGASTAEGIGPRSRSVVRLRL